MPLLRAIGAPSDLDQLSEAAMFRDPKFVVARAKIDITKKIVDRVNLDLQQPKPITVYIHYERITRICTFCGYMFHNVNDCPRRNQLILQQPTSSDEHQEIPYAIYGSWMTNDKHIPESPELLQQMQPSNQMIQRFVQFFSQLTVQENSSSEKPEMGTAAQPLQQCSLSLLPHAGKQFPPLLPQPSPVQRSGAVTMQRSGDINAQSGQPLLAATDNAPSMNFLTSSAQQKSGSQHPAPAPPTVPLALHGDHNASSKRPLQSPTSTESLPSGTVEHKASGAAIKL